MTGTTTNITTNKVTIEMLAKAVKIGKQDHIFGEYFCGNKISDYGLEHGYVDYRTLAKAFDAVMNNGIMSATSDIGYWEQVNGYEYEYNDEYYTYPELEELKELVEAAIEDAEGDSETEDLQIALDEIEELLSDGYNMYPDIFQYFIISDAGAEILQRYTHETVWYNEVLDMYVWGIDHWGTSWDYVLTEIPCK